MQSGLRFPSIFGTVPLDFLDEDKANGCGGPCSLIHDIAVQKLALLLRWQVSDRRDHNPRRRSGHAVIDGNGSGTVVNAESPT